MRMASELAVSKAARRQSAKSQNCSQRVHDDAHIIDGNANCVYNNYLDDLYSTKSPNCIQ